MKKAKMQWRREQVMRVVLDAWKNGDIRLTADDISKRTGANGKRGLSGTYLGYVLWSLLRKQCIRVDWVLTKAERGARYVISPGLKAQAWARKHLGDEHFTARPSPAPKKPTNEPLRHVAFLDRIKELEAGGMSHAEATKQAMTEEKIN